MAFYLLDTTTLTHLQRANPKVTAALAARAGDVIGITTVNVEEVIGGWFSVLRRANTNAKESQICHHLAASFRTLSRYPVFAPTEAALDRYD